MSRYKTTVQLNGIDTGRTWDQVTNFFKHHFKPGDLRQIAKEVIRLGKGVDTRYELACKKYAKPFCTYNFLRTANGPKWLGSGKANKVYNRLQTTVFRESQKQRLTRGENKFRDITNQLQRARESKQYLNEELHKRDNVIVDKENTIVEYKKKISKLKRKNKLNQAKLDEDAQVIINIRLCACLLHTLIHNLTSLLSYLIQR